MNGAETLRPVGFLPLEWEPTMTGSPPMSSTTGSSKAVTTPKGRPTVARDGAARRRSDRMITLQWVGFGAAIVAVLVLAIVMSRGQEPIPLHQR